MNINEVIKDYSVSKTISISADEDSKKAGISKKINFTVDFDGSPLAGVFMKAASSIAISWQTKNRKHYEALEDGQKVVVKFIAPSAGVITEEMARSAYTNNFSKLTPAEQKAEIAKLEAEMNASNEDDDN